MSDYTDIIRTVVILCLSVYAINLIFWEDKSLDRFYATIGWYPTIGDPSFFGWFTVFAYLSAFILSLRVVSVSKYIFIEQEQAQKRFWIIIAVLMLFLCINKQLDLQSLFTASGRYILREQGMYEYKRLLQVLFIASIFIIALSAFYFIVKKLYGVTKQQILAIVGIVFLLMFIFIRASSFHNVDTLIGYSLMGFKMNWILELTGIGLILINGVLWLARAKNLNLN
jgi:hypothetical protein